MMRTAITTLTACGLAASASAAPVVDGQRDATYGAPIVVQTVQTQFGDAMPPGNLTGSELDAAYARVEGGRLYLLLTGNHEPNLNKLEVFFDSVAGGENTLSPTPDYDFDAGGGSWISSNLNGLTFDTGFAADYHMFSRWNGGGSPYEVDFINRQGGGSAMVPGSTGTGSAEVGLVSSGFIPAGAGGIGPNASAAALTQNLEFAINDNNAAGVLGGTGAADQVAAAAVTTGMEFSIALADLGLAPSFVGDIKIAAMIDNGDHNYLSNQVLGGLPAGTGNLGGDGGGTFTGDLAGVDFRQFPGDQYFTVFVPTPGAAGLLAGGLLVATRRRR